MEHHHFVDARALANSGAVGVPEVKRKRPMEVHSDEEWEVVDCNPAASSMIPQRRGNGVRAVVDVVRNKKARENLKEVADCPMCHSFVEMMATETGEDRSSLLRRCQRHRSTHPQPDTPPGYWRVGWDSQEEDQPTKK